MGLLNVNLREIPPQVSLTPVPEGWYKVRIVKSNIKTTAKGDGGYLELQHEVLEGQHQGRIIYWNLNLFNPSATATEIAYKQLSAIGHCLGVFDVQDQNVPDMIVPSLHNHPYYIWVVIGQGNQGPINNVRGCKDINGNDPGKVAAPPMQQGPTAPAVQPQPAPANWQPSAQPSNAAAPVAPGGGAWTPGTNQQPTPAWQPNQPPASAPMASTPAWAPAAPAAPVADGGWSPPSNPPAAGTASTPPGNGWSGGGAPTAPAAVPPAAPQWQQNAQPQATPWRR